MTDKPRIGRPPNKAGYEYRVVGVSGTKAEIVAVLDRLTSRERLEAMLEKIAAQAADDLWQPFETME